MDGNPRCIASQSSFRVGARKRNPRVIRMVSWPVIHPASINSLALDSDNLRGRILDRNRALELFFYDPIKGHLIRKKGSGGRASGSRAGCQRHDGYRSIKIDGVEYLEHRVIWLMEKGDPIPDQIDHKNLIKNDNRIDNFRAATRSQQQANTHGIMKGVREIKGRWYARIFVGRKQISLGAYATAEDAKRAYDTAALSYFGEYARP